MATRKHRLLLGMRGGGKVLSVESNWVARYENDDGSTSDYTALLLVVENETGSIYALPYVWDDDEGAWRLADSYPNFRGLL